MSPLLSLTLVVALASPLAELTYASPPERARPTLEQHKLSAFPRGARLFIASDDVNLRARPALSAGVEAKLPFGAEVRVLERGARAGISSRVDHWYRVEVLPARKEPDRKQQRAEPSARVGWVFGGTLTPFVSQADLDEDKALEQVSASWSWRHAVKLRVFDDGKESASAEWRPAASWRGGRIMKLATHAASAAGVPLVEIEVLIGDPDEAYKTYWRVFYAYRPLASADGPRVLEEAFSTYRNNDVDTRVRFDPATKSAEVTHLRRGLSPSTERYSLAPAEAPSAVGHHEHECFVHVEELPPVLPAGTRVVREQYIVEEQRLAGGGRVVLRHGGCVHYSQVWSFQTPGKKVPRSVLARLTAAKEALAPFEGAGPILEAIRDAIAEQTFDEQGGFPCGDAVCGVEQGELSGAPALVISYDFPL